MLLSLRNTCQVDITCFFAQTGKENTRMWMNIVIYFVNDEKVMQKQGVFHLQASKSVLSNIVEVFMHFWTRLRGVKRVTISVFRGTFKFDNFYSKYHIEANQVNFYLFSRFELCTPSVHRSVPPNVHLGTVYIILGFPFFLTTQSRKLVMIVNNSIS